MEVTSGVLNQTNNLCEKLYNEERAVRRSTNNARGDAVKRPPKLDESLYPS